MTLTRAHRIHVRQTAKALNSELVDLSKLMPHSPEDRLYEAQEKLRQAYWSGLLEQNYGEVERLMVQAMALIVDGLATVAERRREHEPRDC